MFDPEEIEVSDVHHFTIIKAFAERIDLPLTIDQVVSSNIDVDPVTVVLTMILDTLSGAHPVFCIVSICEYQDIELLLGQALDITKCIEATAGTCWTDSMTPTRNRSSGSWP